MFVIHPKNITFGLFRNLSLLPRGRRFFYDSIALSLMRDAMFVTVFLSFIETAYTFLIFCASLFALGCSCRKLL